MIELEKKSMFPDIWKENHSLGNTPVRNVLTGGNFKKIFGIIYNMNNEYKKVKFNIFEQAVIFLLSKELNFFSFTWIIEGTIDVVRMVVLYII